MVDSSPNARLADFGMSLIRERLRQRAPRSAGLEAVLKLDAQLTVDAMPPASPPGKRAAVAAILRDTPVRGPEVLLIRRAEHPLDPWSGHMALPGGREDPADPDLLHTAMRETLEEVALDLRASARLLGRLDDVPAVARGRRIGLTIAPFVFELTRDVALVHNHEVAELLWAPLGPLLRGELAATFPYEVGGQRMELPAHSIEGRIVWGLTHRMLENLFCLLR